MVRRAWQRRTIWWLLTIGCAVSAGCGGGSGPGGHGPCGDTFPVQVTLDDATAVATSLQVSSGSEAGGYNYPASFAHTPGEKKTTLSVTVNRNIKDADQIVVFAVIQPNTRIGTGYSAPIPQNACAPVPVSVTAKITNYFASARMNMLDVVVVIDNSPSMTAIRDKLIAAFSSFIANLRAQPAGMPSLHLAVVSTDTGPGQFDLPDRHCPFQGDAGRFRSTPALPCTTSPLMAGATFLSADQNETVKNYTGDIVDAFSCIARLPTQGCPFSGALKSLRWAIDPLNAPSSNAGFMRFDAALLALIVSNQDDCSVPDDSNLFDPTQTRLTDELGPFSSFRCNEFGHLCKINGTPQNPPRGAAANLMDCTSNETPTGKLTAINDEVAFLKSLKGDPNLVRVAAIAGPTTPYTITTQVPSTGGTTEAQPVMVPSCAQNADERAAPAVRLAQWAQAFGAAGIFQSICANGLQPALQNVGATTSALAYDCFTDVLRDKDPGTPALDPSCTAIDRFIDPNNQTHTTVLPQCPTTSPDGACWTIATGPHCLVGQELRPMRLSSSPVPFWTALTCDTCPPGASLPGCPPP